MPTFLASFYPGDVNGDASVDLQDAILSIQIAAGIIPASPIYLQADVNADGKIGLEEAFYALQTAAELRSYP